SLKIMVNVETVFQVLKTADFATFEKMATKTVYCSPCFAKPNRTNPYMLDSKDFFDNHLTAINQADYFIRATKSHDIILTNDPDHRADIIVLFTNLTNLRLDMRVDNLGFILKRATTHSYFQDLRHYLDEIIHAANMGSCAIGLMAVGQSA